MKWLNTEVCKTSIHRFESGRRLQFIQVTEGFRMAGSQAATMLGWA